jgi:hypothetical protein
MKFVTLLTLAATLGVAISACDGGGAPPVVSHTRASIAASPGVRARGVQVTVRDSIRRAGKRLSDVTLLGPYAAWAEGPAQGTLTQVVVLDTRTGATRVVATAPTGGQVDAVRSGSTQLPTLVAYTVLDHVPSDTNPSTTWRLEAVDVASAARTVIVRGSHADPIETIPVPALFGRWCAWAQYDATSRTNRIFAEDLTTHAVRQVAQHVLSSGLGGDGDTVVYDDNVAPSPDHREIVGVNLINGHRTRLSAVGAVGIPAVANGGITWQQRIGTTRDSNQVSWYLALAGTGSPIQIATSQNGDAIAGRKVVAWLDNGGNLMLAPVPGSSVGGVAYQLLPDPGMVLSIAARWYFDGDRLIWATTDEGMTYTVVHIADVAV